MAEIDHDAALPWNADSARALIVRLEAPTITHHQVSDPDRDEPYETVSREIPPSGLELEAALSLRATLAEVDRLARVCEYVADLAERAPRYRQNRSEPRNAKLRIMAERAKKMEEALRECLSWLEGMDGTQILLALKNPDAIRIITNARAALVALERQNG